MVFKALHMSRLWRKKSQRIPSCRLVLSRREVDCWQTCYQGQRTRSLKLSRPVYSRADLELAALVKRTPQNKIHERRRTNADQTAPGSGDSNADEQTPFIERRWVARQWS